MWPIMTAATSVIRWGILGSGKISSKFAQEMPYVPGSSLQAVASRFYLPMPLYTQAKVTST